MTGLPLRREACREKATALYKKIGVSAQEGCTGNHVKQQNQMSNHTFILYQHPSVTLHSLALMSPGPVSAAGGKLLRLVADHHVSCQWYSAYMGLDLLGHKLGRHTPATAHCFPGLWAEGVNN